jgi:glycosyltransferase involved in cell wall biosynthesis
MNLWDEQGIEDQLLQAIGDATMRPHDVVYFPAFDSQEAFANHYHRARWYLPVLEGVVDAVHMGVTQPFSTTDRPEPMCGPRAGQDAVVLEADPAAYVAALAAARLVLVWRPCSRAVTEALRAKGAFIVDVTTDDPDSVEYGRYAGLLWQLMSEEDRADRIENSRKAFLSHAETLKKRGYRAAAVFGTGPSIDLAKKVNFDGILTIACNTVVQDQELLDHIKPSFISAGDVVSHLGVSTYAERYREDLFRFLQSSDGYFLTTARFAPLITTHYPEIADRVMICEQGVRGPVFDLTRMWKLPSLDSVLNIHMLPIASTFADTIFILGCDGKNPDVTKNEDFWAHSEKAQYHDLVDTGHLCHPTFDINRQKSTFSRFLDSVSTSLELGERAGNIYISLAPSYTPPIGSRAIDIDRLPLDANGLRVPVVNEASLRDGLTPEPIEVEYTGFNGSELLGRNLGEDGPVDVAAYAEGRLVGWGRSDPETGRFAIPLREKMKDGKLRPVTLRAGFGGPAVSGLPVKLRFPPKRKILIMGRVGRTGYSGGRYHALMAGEALAMMGHEVTLWITSLPPFFKDFQSLPKHKQIKTRHAPWDKPPEDRHDFIFVIPDGSYDGSVFEAAVSLAKRDNARLTFFNYESPNWYNGESPVKRDTMEWYWWSKIADYSDVVLSSAATSQDYALQYYDRNRLFRYSGPAINTVTADTIFSPGDAEKQIIIISRFGSASKHKGMADVEAIITPKLAGYTLAFISGTSKGDDDAEIARINALCEAAGAKMKLLKSITDADKFKEIRKSHFMVFPSYFEGYGYPPVEALYMGRPVVCYDLPVLREITGGICNFVPKGDSTALREAVNALIDEGNLAPRTDLRDGIRQTASVQRFGMELQRIVDEAIVTLPTTAARRFVAPLGKPAAELAQSLVRTEADAIAFVRDLSKALVKSKPGVASALQRALWELDPTAVPASAPSPAGKAAAPSKGAAQVKTKGPQKADTASETFEINQSWFLNKLMAADMDTVLK